MLPAGKYCFHNRLFGNAVNCHEFGMRRLCGPRSAACGSRMLEKQLTNIHKRLVRYRKLSVSNKRRAQQSTEEHKEIFQALSDRDAALAETLALRHVERARDNILHAEAAQ